MSEPFVSLESLAIGFDGRALVSGLSLDIPRESFTVVLGANGSGKSTLLRTLLGLLPAVAGRIHFATPPVFGYVPQSAELDAQYPLTAYDVALMGTYGRVRAGWMVSRREREFVHECLRVCGADGFAGLRFSELSGGQKQRALVARALAAKPNLLVLDEPTAGVDVAATRSLLEFISALHRERALTILWVTHDLRLARNHAQQVIWLRDGTLLHGATAEILTPARMAELLEIEV